jgi:hypothetical protein
MHNPNSANTRADQPRCVKPPRRLKDLYPPPLFYHAHHYTSHTRRPELHTTVSSPAKPWTSYLRSSMAPRLLDFPARHRSRLTWVSDPVSPDASCSSKLPQLTHWVQLNTCSWYIFTVCGTLDAWSNSDYSIHQRIDQPTILTSWLLCSDSESTLSISGKQM